MLKERQPALCNKPIINMITYYNYVIKSLKDNQLYIGYTTNLEKRMKDRKNGQVIST